MWLSIGVYTFTALGLFFLARNVAHRESYTMQTCGRTLPFYSLEILLSICLFAIISGARYKTGIDYLSYLEEYRKLQTIGSAKETLEPGFVFISKLFANAGLHFFFYFAFWAALQIGFVYYALINNKYLLPFVGLCIMLGSYYLNWMNGIRQCVVICAFICTIEIIKKRKLWQYMLLVLLMSLCHRSALFLLPVYFLFVRDWKNLLCNRKIMLAVLLLCVSLGATPTWLHFVEYFDKILSIIGYDDYSERIAIMTEENLRDMAWGPGRLSVFFSGVMIIWYFAAMRDYFAKDYKVYAYFLLFFIGICLYNLFANTSHIFLRPIGYFTIFQLPLTAYLLYYLYKMAKSLQFYILLVLTCSNAYISVYKAVINNTATTDFSLYRFFWDYI